MDGARFGSAVSVQAHQVKSLMISRSKERVRHEGVILSSCSMEDILIFKSITEMEGDLQDCKAIITGTMVDWMIFLKELEEQISTGEDVWISWVADRLWILREEARLSIPVLDKIIEMADDYLDRWERSLAGRNDLTGVL